MSSGLGLGDTILSPTGPYLGGGDRVTSANHMKVFHSTQTVIHPGLNFSVAGLSKHCAHTKASPVPTPRERWGRAGGQSGWKTMAVGTTCNRNVSLPQILQKNCCACLLGHIRGLGHKVQVSWILHNCSSGSGLCEITWSKKFKELSCKIVG